LKTNLNAQKPKSAFFVVESELRVWMFSGAAALGSNPAIAVILLWEHYDASQVLPSLALRESKASHSRSSSHTSTRPALVDNLLF